MKYEFELDDVAVDLLHTVINQARVKYLSIIPKCIISPDHMHQGVYTVGYCMGKIRALDELEATMLNEDAVYTHDDQTREELAAYMELTGEI